MLPRSTKVCTPRGACAQACLVQVIHLDNPQKVDEKTCISCMRCISVCSYSARRVNSAILAAAGLMLKSVSVWHYSKIASDKSGAPHSCQE